jgi:hypothetical protein
MRLAGDQGDQCQQDGDLKGDHHVVLSVHTSVYFLDGFVQLFLKFCAQSSLNLLKAGIYVRSQGLQFARKIVHCILQLRNAFLVIGELGRGRGIHGGSLK